MLYDIDINQYVLIIHFYQTINLFLYPNRIFFTILDYLKSQIHYLVLFYIYIFILIRIDPLTPNAHSIDKYLKPFHIFIILSILSAYYDDILLILYLFLVIFKLIISYLHLSHQTR